MKRKVLLKGQAGLDLLHRISSIDILSLPAGTHRKGLILNPAGRIQSLFEIARTGPDSAEIGFRDGFLELLDHYTFAERYEVATLEPDAGATKPLRERILDLEPEEGREFLADGETNPLDVNLGAAIDANKGCYPGQEVIEKIQALGSPARRLCLLRKISGPSPGALPAVVFDEAGTEAGKLTSADEEFALAILRRTHLKAGLALVTGETRWRIEKVSG